MPAIRPQPADAPSNVGRLYAAHAAATVWFRAQLHRNHGPVAYLRRRGLDAVVDRDAPWRIGFAPHIWSGLVDYLHGLGFTDSELLRGGLAFRGRDGRLLDRFRDRVIFPLRDGDGRVVGFIGRLWRPPSAHDRHAAPKYLNSPHTPIYHKSQVLFGLYEQRDRTDAGYPPVIVEGPTDALAIWTAYTRASRTGVAGLATCGTALTRTQFNLATDLPGSRRHGIGVAFDGDDAGRKATERAYHLLAQHHPSLVTRGVRLAAGADPADLACTSEGRARLRATLRHAQPLLHLVIDDRIDQMLARSPRLLHEVEGRVLLARAVLPLIAEQSAATITDAVAHVIAAVVARVGDTSEAAAAASEAMHCLTSVLIDYLETTAPPSHSVSRSPPQDRAPAVAFLPRPSLTRPSAASTDPPISGPRAPSSRRAR